MTSQSSTIALITGANTGIGWETAKALLQSATTYHVLIGTRSLEKGEDAIARLRSDVPSTSSTAEALQIDVSSDDSIANAFATVQKAHGRLDVLVNNSGIALDADYVHGEISMREAFNKSYDVNVTGANLVTYTFAPLLIASPNPRLIFLASGIASTERMSKALYPIPGPIPAGWPKNPGHQPSPYRIGKTALNMMMLSWYWTLKEDGVKVWAVSPGFLATGLGGDKAQDARKMAGPAEIGGKLITAVVEGERDEDVGKVVDGAGIQPF